MPIIAGNKFYEFITDLHPNLTDKDSLIKGRYREEFTRGLHFVTGVSGGAVNAKQEPYPKWRLWLWMLWKFVRNS